MEYHTLLTDSIEKDASEQFYEETEAKYVHLIEKVNNYERSVEKRLSARIEEGKDTTPFLGESASRVSSVRSRSSSVRSDRARAAAKKAALQAKTAALVKQQELEDEAMRMRQRHDEEEMRLQQKLQKLHLETEIAAAQAEETVFTDAERELQSEHPSLGSRASGVRSLRGRQKMDDEHSPNRTCHVNEQRSLLNPMAGEWQPEQRSHQLVLSAEHNNDEIIQVLQ